MILFENQLVVGYVTVIKKCSTYMNTIWGWFHFIYPAGNGVELKNSFIAPLESATALTRPLFNKHIKSIMINGHASDSFRSTSIRYLGSLCRNT